MITLSSTDAVLRAMHQAHSVALSAYFMRSGRVLRALEDATKRGARVTVRLEASPFEDTSGDLKSGNVRAIRALTAIGANAHVVDSDGSRPLHLKAALVDNELFLDDRNWPDDGRDTILRDTDPRDIRTFTEAIGQFTKRFAARDCRGRGVAARSECNVPRWKGAPAGGCGERIVRLWRVYCALKTVAQEHLPVRLLVAERDLNATCSSALQHLIAQGVAVRMSTTMKNGCRWRYGLDWVR